MDDQHDHANPPAQSTPTRRYGLDNSALRAPPAKSRGPSGRPTNGGSRTLFGCTSSNVGFQAQAGPTNLELYSMTRSALSLLMLSVLAAGCGGYAEPAPPAPAQTAATEVASAEEAAAVPGSPGELAATVATIEIVPAAIEVA